MKKPARLVRPRRVWLSVDWDFFQEERVIWDWGHREGGKLFSEFLWQGRSRHMGQDIKPLTSPEAHRPRASEFWAKFAAADRAAPEIGVGDSHALGLPFFWHLAKRDGVPDEIWNFDAHHDLGYHDLKTLRGWAREGRAEAGSWLYVLMKQRKCKQLVCEHVYPLWKKHTVEGRPWEEDTDIDERVYQTRASEFHWDKLANFSITGVFIAKSEAWSPPWNDKAFSSFVRDASASFGFVDTEMYGKTNALNERKWDAAADVAYWKQVDEFRAGRGRVTGG